MWVLSAAYTHKSTCTNIHKTSIKTMPCYSSENDILAFHTHKFSRYLHHDPCSAILNEEMSILNEDMSKVLGALFYVVKQRGPDLSWFFYENSLLWLRGSLHRLHGDKCSNLILQFPYSPSVARSHLVLSLKGRLLSYSKFPLPPAASYCDKLGITTCP